MTTTNFDPDQRWHSHYENAAERLFPGVAVLDGEQDAQCVADADARLAADLAGA